MSDKHEITGTSETADDKLIESEIGNLVIDTEEEKCEIKKELENMGKENNEKTVTFKIESSSIEKVGEISRTENRDGKETMENGIKNKIIVNGYGNEENLDNEIGNTGMDNGNSLRNNHTENVNRIDKEEKENDPRNENGAVENGNTSRRLMCDLCHSDENVILKCLDCDEFLCRICSMVHEKIKATKDHQTVPVQGGDQALHTLSKNKVFCGIHIKEEINLFCKTCDMFICTDCVIDNHRKHDFMKSSIMMQKAREELLADFNQINSDIPVIKTKLQSIQKLKANNTVSSVQIKDKIQEKQNKMVAQINKVCDNAFQQYDQLFINNDQKLCKTEQILETDLSELETLNKTSEVLKSGTEAEIIQTRKLIQAKLSKIKSNDHQVEVQLPHFNDEEIEKNILQAVTGKAIQVHEKPSVPKEPIRRSQSMPNGMLQAPKFSIDTLSTFKHKSDKLWSICPISEDRAWIHCFHSCNIIDLVNKQGQILKSVKLDFYVTDFARMSDGNIIVCSYGKKFIKKMSPDGTNVTDVVKKTNLHPRGLCMTGSGDILVCMIDDTKYDLVASSKRRVVRMSKTGRIMQSMEYNKQGSRLFTAPIRVAENPLTRDICVVDDTGCYSGRLCILDNKGRMKTTYTGGQIGDKFHPCKVVCDTNGQIIVCDQSNHQVHLLDSTGEFLGYLLREKDGVQYPTSVALDTVGSLWVACWNGQVYVMKFTV